VERDGIPAFDKSATARRLILPIPLHPSPFLISLVLRPLSSISGLHFRLSAFQISAFSFCFARSPTTGRESDLCESTSDSHIPPPYLSFTQTEFILDLVTRTRFY